MNPICHRITLAEMIRRFDETGHSQIMVEPVADVTAYGVVDCKGVELALW